MAEIEAEAAVVNDETAPEVIKAIEKAKKEGWQLFPPEQLEKNAKEWKETLARATEKFPPEWLATAKELSAHMPLIHVVDPDFLAAVVEQGYIPCLASREGKGRTADYEKTIGLADYVFLSVPTWIGAGGVPIFFNPEAILEKEETIVTINDFVHLVGLPFKERVRLYQRMAFKGSDFKELLPYFLVVHYGDLKESLRREVVADGYPTWFIEVMGNPSHFHPEIKVKGKLVLTDDCWIEAPPWGVKEEEQTSIEDTFQNRIVSFKSTKLEVFL